MARLHAMHLTEAEMQGLHNLLTTIRNDTNKQPHATHSQYYQAIVMRAMMDGLIQRIDARLDQIRQKGTP